MNLDLIACMAMNGAIGRDGGIPWHAPEDMRFFKQTTMGRVCLVTSKTWRSIPKGLPGRTCLVLSRRGCGGSYPSLDDALQVAEQLSPGQPPMVIGGGQLYAQALPIVNRMYLTFLKRDVAGDVVFPTIDWAEWELVWEDDSKQDLRFTEYRRVIPPAKDPHVSG